MQDKLEQRMLDFVRHEASAWAAAPRPPQTAQPTWSRLKELGTELWLDTGSITEAAALWNRDFSALTTNNTLLNKEVQAGQYDRLIVELNRLLAEFTLAPRQKKLELAFALNAVHGLRLVKEFGARVSVEEHTDLAHDMELAVWYGRRLYDVCPDHFIVKIPFTPAGLLATRRLAEAGLPVNHTLGFSARQNFVISRIGRPAYVNVFLGRLNAFVSDNGLGDGMFVGEKAVIASQQVVRNVCAERGLHTRQIGASLRSGEQIRDLAGLDVLTMPPKAAQQFLALGLSADSLQDTMGKTYTPGIRADVRHANVGFHTLWDVDSKLVRCVEDLEREPLARLTADGLVDFFARHGCADVLPRWTDKQIALSAGEGKIPRLTNWAAEFAAGAVGLDSVMNLAGLNSFVADQVAMDKRVADLIR